MKELKLSDETIGHVAKLLQLALLTGTDIVDNMRMLRLASEDGETLVPHPSYTDRFQKSLEDLMNDQNIEEMRSIIEETKPFLSKDQYEEMLITAETVNDPNFTLPVDEKEEPAVDTNVLTDTDTDTDTDIDDDDEDEFFEDDEDDDVDEW
jgi:hypothetical protein